MSFKSTHIQRQLVVDGQDLFSRGFQIVPCKGDVKGKKVPCVPWKNYDPTLDQLLHDIQRCNASMLAVIHADGIVCRDFDTVAGYHDWAEEHLPMLEHCGIDPWTIRTSKGFRVYCFDPAARFGRYTAGAGYGAGELICGANHYSIVAGIHPSGCLFETLNPLPIFRGQSIAEQLGAHTVQAMGFIPDAGFKSTSLAVDVLFTSRTSGLGVQGGTKLRGKVQRASTDVRNGTNASELNEDAHRNCEPEGFNDVREAGLTLPTDWYLAKPKSVGGQRVRQLLLSTAPRAAGTRNQQLMQFALGLYKLGFQPTKALLRKWITIAERRKAINTTDLDTNWRELLTARKNIDRNKNPLFIACDRAREFGPLPLGRSAFQKWIASLCLELQRIVGFGQPFFLSERDAAAFAGCSSRNAAHALKSLCKQGILAPGQKGTRYKASEWFFMAEIGRETAKAA